MTPKQTLAIPRLNVGMSAQYDAVNVPAAPFDITRCDRAETAPRRRGLVAKRSMADLFIAELRQAHQEGR